LSLAKDPTLTSFPPSAVFKSKGIWHRPHQASQLKLDSTFLAPTPFPARSKAFHAHSHLSSSALYKNRPTSYKRCTAVRAQSSSEKQDIKSKAATAVLQPPVSVAVDAASKTLTPEQPQELEAPDGAGLSTKAGFGLRSAGERVVSNLLNLLYKPVEEPNPILEGNFAPVEELPGAVPVKIVEGALPADFPAGSYVRTGGCFPYGHQVLSGFHSSFLAHSKGLQIVTHLNYHQIAWPSRDCSSEVSYEAKACHGSPIP
jgi:hypothetical protein